MLEHLLSFRSSICRQLPVLAALSMLGLSASQAGAPPVQADSALERLLAERGSPGSEGPSAQDQQMPLADLDEVLEATRTKLEELTEATAIAAANSKLRGELEALKKNNQRLTAELAKAGSSRSELESATARAAARIAELMAAADAARRESARLEEALTQLQSQNDQLNKSMTSAQTALEAAKAKAEKAQAEMAQKLKEATDGAARSKAELAAAKEQLGQAASAAVEAERARQAARSEADARQADAARGRQELAAARTEIERITSTNARLEQRIATLDAAARSATETARQNLIAMAEKIAALNLALDPASQEAARRLGPQAEPDQVADEPATATSAASQPPAPGAASNSDAGQPSADATDVAIVEQRAAPREVEVVFSQFQADVQALNDVELKESGKDLFSGVKSVSGNAVDIRTTTLWDSLPPIGQQSYLDTLLERWVAEGSGEGPATVRIVDESGRVLIEKSKP